MASDVTGDRLPFRELLVPLDGSPAAERALGPAVDLAGRTGVPLRLLSGARPRARRVFIRYLDDVRRRLGAVAAEAEVAGEPVVDSIWAAADPGTLVCLASHGRGGAARAVRGSVAEAVIGMSDEPVLVVGPHAGGCAGFGAGRVVACLDGSETGDRVLAPARAWARCLGLPLWLLEVAPPGPPAEVVTRGVVVEGGYLAARAADEPGTAGWDVVRSDDPAAGLVDFARRVPVAVLIVAAHARTGLDRLAWGSVTARAVHGATVPVLAVPPADRLTGGPGAPLPG